MNGQKTVIYHRAGTALAALVVLLSAALPGVFAADGALSLWVSEQGRARLDFNIAGHTAAVLIVDHGAVSVELEAGESQTLAEGMEAFNGEIGVDIADYNFDGLSDIAVLESYGYGGVNIFSAVYVFDPHQSTFRRWLTESNIRIDAVKRELRAGQKSGPRYFTKSYRLYDGQPYVYRESVLVGSELEKVILRNEHGNILETVVADLRFKEQALVPAVRRITAERAYFYEKPDDAAKTSAYVIRGDDVELLNSAGDWDEWFLVRYRGEQVFEKWIKGENLEK